MSTIKNIIIGIQFRVISAVVCTLFITALLIFSLSQQRISDVIPPLDHIDEKKLSELGPFAAQVNTGIYILDFATFDVLKGNFVMDAFVWFEFNPAEIGLEQIAKFSFVSGEILHKNDPDVWFDRYTQDTIAMYQVKVSFQSKPRFHYFPFDAHSIPILLTNTYVTPYEMIFTTTDSGFNISPRLTLANWNIGSVKTSYGFSQSVLDPYDDDKETESPEALFIINIMGIGIKNILIIFIPLLFGLLISLFSLLLSYAQEEGIKFMRTLSSAGITSLLAYRFVIQSIIPNVGYSTTTDSIYTLCLLTAFIPFIMQIIFSMILQQSNPPSPKLADTLTFLSVLAFILISMITLPLLWYFMFC
jgi:hypothetical protein